MAATVSEAATGIKNQLNTIAGLRCFDYIPDNFQPPMAMVAIDSVEYHQAFGGGDPVYNFNVTVVVARTAERNAFLRLDGFLSWDSPTSIRAAIEADKTLNGTIQNCFVPSAGDISAIQINDATYLSVVFNVIVHA